MLPKSAVTERLGLAHPVIQAAAIVGGHTAAAAFTLGASTVQVCTTFLCNADTKISDPHRRALANAGDESTRVTRLHSGKPARAIRNRLLDELANAEDQIDPCPSQRSLVAPLASKGESAYLALWAGHNVGLTREMPAAGLYVSRRTRGLPETLFLGASFHDLFAPAPCLAFHAVCANDVRKIYRESADLWLRRDYTRP